MNLREFYVEFAHEYGVSQEKAKKICKTLFNLLGRCIVREGRVYIAGFGTFNTKIMKEHRAGSLNGGIQIIPEKKKIVFNPTPGMGIEKEDEEDEE